MPSYLTDGMDLYEVVGETIDDNYGLLHGQLRRTWIQRCRAPRSVQVLDDTHLLLYRFVIP